MSEQYDSGRDRIVDRGWTGVRAGPRDRSREQGVVLLVALFFTILTASVVFMGSLELDRQRKAIDLNLYWRSHAHSFAEAGLVEAKDWFRRQSKQPVQDFAPQYAPLASPPVLDTIDPSIGLVREYEIGRDVWGRFEVRIEVPGQPGVPEVEDVSKQRGIVGAGSVWRLVSRSFVYRRRDPLKAWDQAPNIALATKVLETEIKRMSFAPPALGAILASDGKSITVSAFGRVSGGTAAGVAFPSGSGSPGGVKKNITGSPAESAQATWYDSPEQVFGVSETELRAMADLVISSTAELPDPLPTNKLVFADCDLAVTDLLPLNGTCFLYVKGDLQVFPNSNSTFNGFLYVAGDFLLQAPATVNGMVMIRGNANVIGTGDWAEVNYDGEVVDGLLLEIGQYRRSTAIYDHDLTGTIK